MKTKEYLCPHCGGQLKIDNDIIFSATNSSKQKGIIILNQEIGNYTAKYHPDFIVNKGDTIEFYCPICNTNLTERRHVNLAKVKLVTDSKVYDIYFSKVAGEKCTYQIVGEHMSIFGEDRQKYVDFFNLAQVS